MALTEEILKGDSALEGLTDAQLSVIATLSKNDEETVIGTRIGELHGSYDKDILESSGIEKENGEKSYDYAKRVINSLKSGSESVSTLNSEIETQKTTIAELTEKIKSGNGNEVIAQQLKDAQDALSTIKGQYESEKETWRTKEKEHSQSLVNMRVNNAFDAIKIKFKSDYPESIQNTLLNTSRSQIMSQYKPDFVDAGNGKQTLVFRNEKGEIARNPQNQLNPYTAEELMKDQLKDVIDLGRNQTGGGTKGSDGSGDNFETLDIGSATTQVQADEIIVKTLLKQGYTRGSTEFAEKQKELRSQYKVQEMKLR